MKTVLSDVSVITASAVLPHHAICIEAGRIAAVAPMDKCAAYTQNAHIIDARGAYAAPGLIDAHIHGFAGFGVEDAAPESLLNMSLALAKEGVTAFCPTLYCAQPDDMERVLKQTSPAIGQERGAHIIGYHLEGPFISPRKPGVMKPQDIAPASLPVLERLYQAARGNITSMTLAPELPGLDGIIRFCQEKHILLQAGHTNASYEEFLQGVRAGITHTTHLFNAMSAFNHREPGAAGATLMRPEVSAELIADGVHVHPAVIAFVRQVKPVENILLVTDALKPTRQAQPPFIANGEQVTLKGGVWRRETDGVIAGSALTMLLGVKNLTKCGFTLPQAVQCATANPARLLGLQHKGRLAPGYDADIVLFSPEFNVIKTFLSRQTQTYDY